MKHDVITNSDVLNKLDLSLIDSIEHQKHIALQTIKTLSNETATQKRILVHDIPSPIGKDMRVLLPDLELTNLTAFFAHAGQAIQQTKTNGLYLIIWRKR